MLITPISLELELVQFDGPMAGFHEHKPTGDWKGFTPFKHVPNINTKDPNLRFVDVTGDGFSDILISEDTVFTCYGLLMKEGFAPASRSPKCQKAGTRKKAQHSFLPIPLNRSSWLTWRVVGSRISSAFVTVRFVTGRLLSPSHFYV